MQHFDSNYLDALNELTLRLLIAGRAMVGPDWRGNVEDPDFTRLYCVTAGEALITTDREDCLLAPGSWYLLPAGCSFSYRCPEKLDHIYFHLKLCTANGFDLLRCCREPLSLPAAPQGFFLEQVPQPALLFGLQLRQALYTVLLDILSAHGTPLTRPGFSPCVEKALIYINSHLHAGLDIDTVAAGIFVSRSTLTKHFRRELGTSVNAYLHEALLSQGRQLLVNTGLSVREISERLGYSDQFYFSRRFREKYGLPPQKYRSRPFV